MRNGNDSEIRSSTRGKEGKGVGSRPRGVSRTESSRGSPLGAQSTLVQEGGNGD